MASDPFPYASNSNHFLGAAGLGTQPFAVLGVPFDGAVSNRPGARFGPQAIRRASQMLCDAEHPLFELSPVGLLGDGGDLALPNASGVQQARREIERQAKDLMMRHHCVFLGGDHSITLALLRAAHAVHGPLALIHFDAHCDTWPDHFGEPSGHGTWLYEALEASLVRCEQTVQIGLRSSGDKQVRHHVRNQGGLIFEARDLRGLDGPGLEQMLTQVRARVGKQACYLTLDIDCLDPAFAPATGTPEPAGLSSSQVMTCLEGLAALNFVGMDCVEVAPAYDHAEITSLAAAQMVWTYLAACVSRHVDAGR